MPAGTLTVAVTAENEYEPVAGAGVYITSAESGRTVTLNTDEDGLTERVTLDAPPASISIDPNASAPAYYTYDVTVSAQGYGDAYITGVQIFDGINAMLPVTLSSARERTVNSVDIPPPAVTETVRPEPEGGMGRSRVLSRVYIPARIRVHLGSPASAANNVSVSFPEYIKNVASSEIYPTWPNSAIRANIYAQIGFALNRVFTEWYPSRGYAFDITNSTAYDQSFVYGRNIFDNISEIVDEIFNVYPRRQGYIEPLFTAYCNGTTVSCAGLSQWGTVTLANGGLLPYQIIRYYYGNDVDLVAATEIRGIESSYPGFALRQGMRDDAVRVLQQQLNRVRENYPGIPRISSATGYFGSETLAAVRKFQSIFGLTQDDIVGRATWNKLQYVYAAVKGLAEPGGGEGQRPSLSVVPYPGFLLRYGASGEYVRYLQEYLLDLSTLYYDIPSLDVDGVFGSQTLAAVRAFQSLFGLTPDGVVGPATWNTLTLAWENSF